VKVSRLLVRTLKGINPGPPKNLFKFQRSAFYSSYNLVRAFYAICVYLMASRASLWNQWPDVEYLTSIWPVFWIHLTGIKTGVLIILIGSAISALACLLFGNKRIFRIIWFIAIMNYVGFSNSFGKIDHGWHVVIAFSFLFIFLPEGNKEFIENSRIRMERYLTVFWGALALFMTFYTMSGICKIAGGAAQLAIGETSMFSTSSFALRIAHKMLAAKTEPILGDFFIKYERLGWLFFLSGIYIELFSIVAIFRNSLHRVWGLLLILFHVGVYLAMGIGFSINILFLAVFLCNSPFSPPKNEFRTALKNIPVVPTVLLLYNRLQFRKVPAGGNT
jgi:hypothetical protein